MYVTNVIRNIKNFRNEEILDSVSILSCYRANKTLNSFAGLENTELKEVEVDNTEISRLHYLPHSLIKLRCTNSLVSCLCRCTFTNLLRLDLNGNKLENLYGLECPHLEYLDVHTNRLISLDGIEGCNKLTNLNLSRNKLTSLKGIENMSNLETFECDNNKLKTLEFMPKTVTILSCVNNKLTTWDYIPMRITYLDVTKNPFYNLLT